ncbi:MAG: NAD(P)-dependent alcohol dehydrogenase [Sphingopyxis sp.]|nr:NAD(P)-dependent alcohol dehydrogenase [Sphingopyxis sp.]
MRAYGIGDQSGLGGLHLQTLPDPQPGAGDIVVRVTAAGLNYRDLMVLRGHYGAPQGRARVPLSDGVGIVTALGEGVTDIAVGDRVIAPHFLGWHDGRFSMALFGADLGVTADGWLAEQMRLPAAAVVKVPDAVGDATAATLAVVGGTVWHAMVAFGEARPGELVLAQGTGGVSIFALQLAKALGADFAITSSSDAKLDICRAMGADYTVNYRTHADWPAALLAATGGRGADVVVDTLGFSALGQTVAATAVEGRIGTLGALSGSPQDAATASQGLIIAKNIAVKGIASGSRAMLTAALDVIAQHGIAMRIDREFGFDDAPAAFAYLESGAHMGKILVRMA